MNILLVGPIASGKGTQAEKLIEKFELANVEMGSLLRSVAEEETPLGEKVKKFLDSRTLVTDDIVVEVVNKYLDGIGRLDGILFDGFPRKLPQAQYFEDFMGKKGLKIDVVINLTLPREEIFKRLQNRRTCEKCGKVYNLLTNPPKTEGLCDFCGGKLIKRSDETSEKTAVGLSQFEEITLPMIEYYRQRGLVEEVDGNRPIEVIFEDIVERLKKRRLIANG
ncbi:MAG TPA: nucleoside monophosphate kinase [Patescibacteria group bacterium]|nr:nucleoside monophosphate kinase [Patescibacteria group bacterium]